MRWVIGGLEACPTFGSQNENCRVKERFCLTPTPSSGMEWRLRHRVCFARIDGLVVIARGNRWVAEPQLREAGFGRVAAGEALVAGRRRKCGRMFVNVEQDQEPTKLHE